MDHSGTDCARKHVQIPLDGSPVNIEVSAGGMSYYSFQLDDPGTDFVLTLTGSTGERERKFFIDNLLARIHCIIVMIMWTGLAPWEFAFPFPGSLTSIFLAPAEVAVSKLTMSGSCCSQVATRQPGRIWDTRATRSHTVGFVGSKF